MKVIAVIGQSGSGKTATIEYLTRNLTQQGFKIGTMKHVHHPNFTIDTEGKDTWRHAHAGAKIVSTVASDEVAIIRKTKEKQRSLDYLLSFFKKDKLDLVFLEGFHQHVSKRHDIYKIISARSHVDLEQVLKNTANPILAITGRVSTKKTPVTSAEIPLINIKKDGQELTRIIRRDVLGKTGRRSINLESVAKNVLRKPEKPAN